jgi:hypothetical protein
LPTASIVDIAKYILRVKDECTTMKLQKLCYYSQAWTLVWDDIPLFPEDFEAWANGPVSPVLFALHKGMFVLGDGDLGDYDPVALTDRERENVGEEFCLNHAKFHSAERILAIQTFPVE